MDPEQLAIKAQVAHKSPFDWDVDIQHLLETLQQTKSLRNAAVPINRLLPADVLRMILLEAQSMIWQGRQGTNRWMSLCWVCQHWRHIALGYQWFWRKICINYGTSAVCITYMLELSGSVPLVVVLQGSSQWRGLPMRAESKICVWTFLFVMQRLICSSTVLRC